MTYEIAHINREEYQMAMMGPEEWETELEIAKLEKEQGRTTKFDNTEDAIAHLTEIGKASLARSEADVAAGRVSKLMSSEEYLAMVRARLPKR